MAVTVEINYLAVLVAAIAGMVIGALWYSVLFGKKWMGLMKISPQDIEKAKKEKGKMARAYVLNFITLLIMAYVLAHLVDYTESTTAVQGSQAGFWAWLGFVATVLLGGFLWENKPFALYVINAAHYLVSLLVMGAILAVWV